MSAQFSEGIFAQSITGAVAVETIGTINSLSNGIAVFAGSGSVNVNVLSGSITSGAAGILTTAVSGSTNIANFGTVTGSLASILATGLGSGSVTVANAGNVSATGSDAPGIFVQTNSGTALVNSTGSSEERRVGKECRSRWSPYH